LKHLRIPYLFSFLTALLVATGNHAQDVHFAQVQDMNIWYNPALKTTRDIVLHANMRSVKYQDIIAYTSKAATIELPLTISTDNGNIDKGGFMNLTAGMNASSSGDGVVNVSAAMLALSYALPLNHNNTYLAAGFQATYNFSRTSYNGYNSFPDKFDQYGPIASAVLADPYGSGYLYQYFSAAAGITVFHSGEKKQWYMGGSIRHLNRPLTDPTQLASYRLPVNLGIQAGYTEVIADQGAISGYSNLTWQRGTHEHVIGALYTRNLGDSARSAVSLGIGYRVGDALMPNFGFKTGRNRFAFCYEFNISGIVAGNYNRRSFEISYTMDL
jgi:type IX secretion system PorP/SprF family membrane protein